MILFTETLNSFFLNKKKMMPKIYKVNLKLPMNLLTIVIIIGIVWLLYDMKKKSIAQVQKDILTPTFLGGPQDPLFSAPPGLAGGVPLDWYNPPSKAPSDTQLAGFLSGPQDPLFSAPASMNVGVPRGTYMTYAPIM